MKIYTVRTKPTGEMLVESLEVTETQKMYINYDGTAGSAFGYRSRFQKEDCSLSPAEAILKRKNQILSFLGGLKDKVIEEEKDLKEIQRLESLEPKE